MKPLETQTFHAVIIVDAAAINVGLKQTVIIFSSVCALDNLYIINIEVNH